MFPLSLLKTNRNYTNELFSLLWGNGSPSSQNPPSAVHLAAKEKKLHLQPHKAVRFISPVLSHKIEAVSPDGFLP